MISIPGIKNKIVVLLLSIVIIGLIGIIDFYSGYEISFAIFYLVPIAICSLYKGVGKFEIILNSIIATVAWYLAETIGNFNYSNELIPMWNAIMRLGIFITVGLLLFSLKSKNRDLEDSNERLVKLNKKVQKQKNEISDVNELLEKEALKSESLLRNILPEKIIQDLKENQSFITEHYDECTVMFTDFKDFVKVTELLPPNEIVDELNYCFGYFDDIVKKYSIEKIKTMGDAYMCVGGVPSVNNTNALDVVLAALEMNHFIFKYQEDRKKIGKPFFEIRIGIHTGSLIAGVVGKSKFTYDVWGDTVNVSSRLEKASEPGRINLSEETFQKIKNYFNCSFRGEISIKNKKDLNMYFIDGIKDEFRHVNFSHLANKSLISMTSITEDNHN